MIKINIKTEEKTKSYFVNFYNFEFDNLLYLIFELFELFKNNELINKRVEDIVYEQILSLGYKNVIQIPKKVKKELENWYFKLIDKQNKKFDDEKQTYLLMAKIVNKEILVVIDNSVIENYNQPLMLNKNSIISFTDIEKINDIKFTTI